MTSPPKLTFEQYETVHREFYSDIIFDTPMGWGEGALPLNVRECMAKKNADAGYAVNMYSRIAHARCTALRLDELMKKEAQLPFFAIDLVSADHMVTRSDAYKIDLKTVKKWVRKQLPGASFIGGIDAAYYYNGELAEVIRPPFISWHTHVIAWGLTEQEVRALQKKRNSDDPGTFHYWKLDHEEVVSCAMYAIKAPMSEYCVYLSEIDQLNSETGAATGIHYGKELGELRPGTQAEIAKLLNDRRMDEVLIAGGGGKRLRRAIFIDAWWLLSEVRRCDYERKLRSVGMKPLFTPKHDSKAVRARRIGKPSLNTASAEESI
ncbi:hypothetical protein GOB98_10470 [Sinorhizobium meliloti]|nr:hypothetical protein [Sinorhizobium meliloti]MDW9976513.1 hypothetical protein [Sinorhizobium meliloti]MDX0293236.1 hypothetical protein [Sinorhizobium meliloti]